MKLARYSPGHYYDPAGHFGVVGSRSPGEGPRGGTVVEWEVAAVTWQVVTLPSGQEVELTGIGDAQFHLSGMPVMHRTKREAVAALERGEIPPDI